MVDFRESVRGFDRDLRQPGWQWRLALSENLAPTDDSEQDHDDGNHQEDMNEAPHGG